MMIPPGYGYLDISSEDRVFVCDDRGGALRTEWLRNGITRIDLRFKTHWSAMKFGRKTIPVLIQMPAN